MKVLDSLVYFSIFNYPLTIDEIQRFSNVESIEDCERMLEKLLEANLISNLNGYFFLGDDLSCVERRIKGNELARKLLLKAKGKAKLISHFPFVRGVAVSGSLSKGYADEKSDIDFFIITTSNRLWICRSLLILYKKIFLFNSHKKFCINYCLAENGLEIEEKNRFTATEISTIIPYFGKDIFEQFYIENEWTQYYIKNRNNFPNYAFDLKKNYLKKTIELLLSNKIANKFESFLKNKTIGRWKKLFSNFNKEDFDLALKSTDKVSKRHPLNYQKKVVDQLENRMMELKKQLELKGLLYED